MNICKLKLKYNIKAVLWDMDGVLIDSMEFDLKICNQLLTKIIDKAISIPELTIRKYFAYAHQQFWKGILSDIQITLSNTQLLKLLEEYDKERTIFEYTLLPGVIETLNKLKKEELKLAVVSSNEVYLIESILKNKNIRSYFDIVVGYDTKSPIHAKQMNKKPSPDMYNAALALLGISAEEAAVIEDSIAGATAGLNAGCTVIGVSTGGATFEELVALLKGKNGYVMNTL